MTKTGAGRPHDDATGRNIADQVRHRKNSGTMNG